jgi:hypothetical protein
MVPYLIGYSIASSDSVIISWNNPSVGPYAGIIIRRSLIKNEIGEQVYQGTGSNTEADGRSSVMLSGLHPNTIYYFTISAYCGDLDESELYTLEVQL